MIWRIVWVYWEGEKRSRPWATYDDADVAARELRRLRKLCPTLKAGIVPVEISDLPTNRTFNEQTEATNRAAGSTTGRKRRRTARQPGAKGKGRT